MKRLSWKYLAGLIDGEGCIDITVSKRNGQYYIQPRVRITMTIVAEELMDNICNNFAGNR
jgi:intein/homing endonuclease